MSRLSDISFRRAAGLFIIALAFLAGGTWLTVKATTDRLVDAYAESTAYNWAQFLAKNATDLNDIAEGQPPSASSMTFLHATRKSGQVFRYVIFNRYGYSQLVVDRDKILPVGLSEFNADAKRSISERTAVVDIKYGEPPNFPRIYAEAYVPVMAGGEPVAVVAAYVNEADAIQVISSTFWMAALTLCGLTALAFAVPSIAWYRRTREKQQADRRIQFLAHHDALTGLANRARLIERLAGLLATLPPTGDMVAVHFIDIDHFKQVNDTLGHDGGDFLLSSIGKRLRAIARIEDLVARLGGDEFVVVQANITDKSQASEFAKRILSTLGAPIYFNEQEINTRVTVGIALAPTDGVTPERLLKSADLALYSGKQGGRNCYRFFSLEMDEALQNRVALERIVRDAAEHDKFQVHYQPVFEMNSEHPIGFEALARLPGPDGTYIPPATFIPVAEESRLIDKIGAFVLNESCRTATLWPEHLTIAVNLSPAQFESGAIEDTVAEALKNSGLEPRRLELEITESLLLGDNAATMACLKRLKDMGVSIVMDDFGTGYSSLSYLWKFPFDKIKIDRSFMEGFENSGRDVETVVKTIIALGREMNMRVTVEGVERPEQVDFLYDADADQVQGFFFGEPVPASEVSAGIIRNFRKPHTGAQSEPGSGRQAAKLSANG